MVKKRVEMWGVDRMIRRFGPDYFAEAVGVSARTIMKWRRENASHALHKAIEKAGSQAELARRLGMPQKTVHQWLHWDIPQGTAPAPRNGIERAVALAGNQPRMAADLGVTQQCVARWCKLGYAPPARAQEIEMQYGVSRAELINPKLRNALGAGGCEL